MVDNSYYRSQYNIISNYDDDDNNKESKINSDNDSDSHHSYSDDDMIDFITYVTSNVIELFEEVEISDDISYDAMKISDDDESSDYDIPHDIIINNDNDDGHKYPNKYPRLT